MVIKNLSIYQFRNIIHEKLTFQSNVVAFLGDNGQGKTNFVESIYFLSKGKSFRSSELEPLIYKNSDQKAVRVFAEFEREDQIQTVEGQILENKKTFLLNNKRSNNFKIFKYFPVVLFSPESLSIIKEGPEERRSLIDEFLILEDEENIRTIRDFRKVLKSRNHLLRRYKQRGLSKEQLWDVLEPVDELFIKYALELEGLRILALKKMLHSLEEIMQEITHTNVSIFVDYVDENGVKREGPSDYNTMFKSLKESLDIELHLGVSRIGPHKHDIKFYYNGKESRFYCSQGQQRALILGLKLTQILYHHSIYGYYPILILDDVLSELDRTKRAYLIKFLEKKNAQTFLTSTDIENHQELKKLNLEKFNVRNGAVVKG